MKKLIFLPVSLLLALSGFGQLISAKILDPFRQNYTAGDALFSSVDIHIKPQGLYANIELTFEIESKNDLDANKQYEFEYLFNLPAGCILHEAYLWINNAPVKAKLYEKSEAKMVYESHIVRTTDPLIINKSSNRYEARIYPILKNEVRRFKICILMPMTLKNGKPILDIPIDLFYKNTFLQNDLIVTVDHTTDCGDIEPNEDFILDFQNVNNTGYLVNKASDLSKIASITFANKIGDQLYVEFTDVNKGYFQLTIEDTTVKANEPPKKYVFVLDISQKAAKLNPVEISRILRLKLLDRLKPDDLVQVVFAEGEKLQTGSKGWCSANEYAIDSMFQYINYNLVPDEKQTYRLIEFAIDSIINKTEDSVLLTIISGSDAVGKTVSELNDKIESLEKLKNKACSIYSLELLQSSWSYLWIVNDYSINNSYFFYNLSLKNNGYYFTVLESPYDFYKYRVVNTPEGLLDQFFDITSVRKTYSEMKYEGNSYLIDVVHSNASDRLNKNANLQILGKFIGNIDSVFFENFFEFENELYVKKTSLKATILENSLSEKIWAGTYCNQLASVVNTLSEKRKIIDYSLGLEFLTDYTSFLALEPDTTRTQTLAIFEKNSPTDIEVKAYPNPSKDYIIFETSLSSELRNKDYTLVITDISGKEIIHRQGNTFGQETIKIRIEFAEERIESGIYFATINIGNTKKTIRFIKY